LEAERATRSLSSGAKQRRHMLSQVVRRKINSFNSKELHKLCVGYGQGARGDWHSLADSFCAATSPFLGWDVFRATRKRVAGESLVSFYWPGKSGNRRKTVQEIKKTSQIRSLDLPSLSRDSHRTPYKALIGMGIHGAAFAYRASRHFLWVILPLFSTLKCRKR